MRFESMWLDSTVELLLVHTILTAFPGDGLVVVRVSHRRCCSLTIRNRRWNLPAKSCAAGFAEEPVPVDGELQLVEALQQKFESFFSSIFKSRDSEEHATVVKSNLHQEKSQAMAFTPRGGRGGGDRGRGGARGGRGGGRGGGFSAGGRGMPYSGNTTRRSVLTLLRWRWLWRQRTRRRAWWQRSTKRCF